MSQLNQSDAPRADQVTITQKQYLHLLERDEFLSRLEAAGVDNWDGYSAGFGDDDETEEDDFGTAATNR